MGSTPLCATQEGGTQIDVMTVNVLIGGPGPITVTNIRYTAGSNGSIVGSAGTGPVQLKVAGGGAVGPPFTLSTANTSNAWLTDDLAVRWHGERADHPAVAAGRDLAAGDQRVGR